MYSQTNVQAGIKLLPPGFISNKYLPLPAATGKPRLLIISDSTERLSRLKAPFALDEVEITIATSPEELNCACCCEHDLAVIDVSPERIGGVLKTLRQCAGCAEIPVLVEASRISADARLAGLLPKYRAMPCSHSELVMLARWQIAPHNEERGARGIL